MIMKTIIEFCIECDKLTPFPDGFCYWCGCHSPFGDPEDPEIYDAFCDYYKKNAQTFDLKTLDKKQIINHINQSQ